MDHCNNLARQLLHQCGNLHQRWVLIWYLMLVLPFSGLLEHPMGRAGMWGVQGCPNPAQTHQNFVTFRVSQNSSCGGRRGKCCLVAVASFPAESQPGSLAASPGGIKTMSTDSVHFPAAVTAARCAVGGSGISALLPPGVSLQLAENCPRAGTAPAKSEDVNLLTISSVCVSRQMRLINKGRNVTLSKVLTSKSKYLHRCAGSCQLLGIAMLLGQFMPPQPQQQRGKLQALAEGRDCGTEGEGKC